MDIRNLIIIHPMLLALLSAVGGFLFAFSIESQDRKILRILLGMIMILLSTVLLSVIVIMNQVDVLIAFSFAILSVSYFISEILSERPIYGAISFIIVVILLGYSIVYGMVSNDWAIMYFSPIGLFSGFVMRYAFITRFGTIGPND